MGLSMYDGAVYRALQLKTTSTLWTAIGRTTVWTDEQAPPIVNQTDNDIEEVVAYSKPYTISLCKEVVSGGDVTVDGQDYDFVTDQAALTDQDARFLYMVTEFDPNLGCPYGNFREVAVYADLVPDEGHESDDWLAPADATDPGTLLYLHNNVVTNMSPVRRQIIELVLEFK